MKTFTPKHVGIINNLLKAEQVLPEFVTAQEGSRNKRWEKIGIFGQVFWLQEKVGKVHIKTSPGQEVAVMSPGPWSLKQLLTAFTEEALVAIFVRENAINCR